MRFVHLAVLLAACALIARTTNAVIEASLWTPPRVSDTPQTVKTARAPPTLDGTRLSSLLQLDAHPRDAETAVATTAELPFSLLGTLAPTFACVLEKPTGAVHTLALGDTLAGVELVDVERGAITVRRDGRLERVETNASPSAPRPPPTPGPKPSGTVARSALTRAIDTFPQIASQVRVMPAFQDGQFQGFRLFGVSRVPLFAQAGLHDGDVVRRVNGIDTARPEQLIGLLQNLASLTRVDLELVRGGATVHHAITLE